MNLRSCCTAILVTAALTYAHPSAQGRVAISSPSSQAGGGQGGGLVGGQTGGVVGGPVPMFSPRDGAEVTGSAHVRGRVTDAASGRPIRRARVVISGGAIRGMRTTSTDQNGAYEFVDLPAGSYSITASRPGYVQLAYMQGRPNGTVRPLVVADNQAYDRINIALPLGGVITGRVLDEFGEAVVDATVSVARQQYINGARRLMQTMAPSRTNDIGEFRLYGLAPGDYILSASVRSAINPIERLVDRTGYATTYYPSTSDPTSAQRLAVSAGETLSNIVISLEPAVLARVSGISLDPQNQPSKGGGVMIMPASGINNVQVMSGMIGPNGAFTIEGVPPGQYVLRANPAGGIGGPDGFAAAGTATITVSGADLTNVVVAPVVQVVVRGRLTGDAALLARLNRRSIRVGASPIGLPMFMGPLPPPVSIADDMSFELKVAPGEVILRPTGADILVRAIRSGGADVSHGFTIAAGQSIDDVEVEVASSTSRFGVTVTNTRGEAVASRDVVVFSQDEREWGVQLAGHGAVGRTNDQGFYQSPVLLPGAYYVATPDFYENGQINDPEYLAALSRGAQRVTLRDGDVASVQLRAAER